MIEEKELKGQLELVLSQLKENRTLAEKQQTEVGVMKTETLEKIQSLQTQVDALDTKLAERHASLTTHETLEDVLREDAKLQDFLKNHHGVCNIEIPAKFISSLLERKTVIDTTALGTMTTGVIPIDRTAGIVQEARQALRMRNVLSSRPTLLGTIDYVKVNSAPTIASLQLTEGTAKIENAVTFITAAAYVKTIASWIPMTRQAMDDFGELMGYIRNALPYYVNLREEVEFLHGGGGSTDINGLVTQASALQPALALPAYNKSDLISAAIQQIEVATEIEPSFVVLHPTDYWQILRTKDANRNYVFNNNNITLDPFWGLTPIRTTKMGSGNFLVGSGSPVAAEIRDRMGMELAISTEHSTYFTENKIAVRAEKRVALVCYRPGSFIFGSFTTSP